MPRVTRVRRRGTKARVFIDGEFVSEVDAQTAELRGLYEGAELSSGELDEALREGGRALAMSRALNLLGYRARSSSEIRERLRRHGHPNDIIDMVLARLEELGYLDDEEFARSAAREKARKYGPRRVSIELRRNGVNENVTREIVEEVFSGRSELDDARSAAQRRYNTGGGSDTQARRVYGFLMRRGYSVEVCAEVAREYRGQDPSQSRKPS